MESNIKIMNTDILKALDLETFIAFDTETTGFNPVTDEIIEFGAVKYTNGEIVDSINVLIKPEQPISEEITRITGISNDMVADAPSYKEVHDQITSFLGETPLVAHNVDFDYGRLESHFQRMGESPPENPLYDTLLLARTFTYWLVDHKLATVAKAFNVEVDTTHRANADAVLAGEIFLSLLQLVVATPLHQLRQCTRVLSNLDVHTKPLFVHATNYLIEQDAENGIGTKPIKSPERFNVYGQGNFSFENAQSPPDPIDTYELTRLFTKSGQLGKILTKYEERGSQAEMSEAVANALNDGHFLVAEAGTGVGKSLAYLIPGLQWGTLNADKGIRIVVSSNTKNLQEQLFFKDIPFIHDQLGFDFKAVLLKGRSNYLCKTKWTEFLRNPSRFSDEDRLSAIPLIIWAAETKTGDIDENNGFRQRYSTFLWSKLCSEGGYCTTKRCQAFQGCYLGPLKKEAITANLILVNHSLLLADAAAGHHSIPEYHHLVVDEAHNLEKNAYRYFAEEFNIWAVRNIISPLHSGGQREYGLLVTLKTALSVLKDPSRTSSLISQIDTIIWALKTLDDNTENFLKQFQLQASARSNNTRYRERVRYNAENSPFKSMSSAITEVYHTFQGVIDELKQLYQLLKEFTEDDIPDIDATRQDLEMSVNTFDELCRTFQKIIKAPNDDEIYWYELPTSTRQLPEFVVTPLRVGNVMRSMIYDDLRTAVFTSATIKVGDQFTYFLQRTGLYEIENHEIVTKDFGSPYYLSEQLIGCVTTYLDQPGSTGHSKQIASMVRQISKRYQRGVLVLTTSYRSMDEMFESMESHYKEMEIGLLRQTSSISRTDLVEQFKSEFSSVLIGTESFWEGVDVPGEALEVLIIGKLPFAVPTDPIVEANTIAVENDGGNGFIDYTLPETIIRFRQGFGRLIRSSTDAGVVIIADPRVATKRYGRIIADSLPIDLQACTSDEELFEVLDNWFRHN